MTEIPDYWPPEWKAANTPAWPECTALCGDIERDRDTLVVRLADTLRWIDDQYEQAQAAARSAAHINSSVRHMEGVRAARERSAFHASATARMVALGEVRSRLAAGSSPDTAPECAR